MSLLAQPAVLGAAVPGSTTTLVAAIVGVGVLVMTAAALVGTAAVRRSQARQEALDALLARSRAEVESLTAKVDQLSTEVEASRAVEQHREYVITSLPEDGAGAVPALDAASAPSAARPLEDRLLEVLARGSATALPKRAVEAVVSVVALGSGVRRALSAENLDRAAAEANVARRRSRRTRRQEVREARRVIRSVRSSPGGRDAA